MPVPLKPREVLRDRYRVNRIIGQGGAGCIYLADDLRLEGRQCALKEVEHDLSLTTDLMQEARDQFLREATTLARLDQPNLPKVSDFFSIDNRDYLVMDYVPGKDLRTLMMDAKQKGVFLDENEVINWANQLVDALSYLHSQNPPILHRDIKPSNLKLTPSGLLKLVDFGLVRVLAPGEVTITIIQGQGTALYTPLEQYGDGGSHTDVRTDIYAFGATFYHLLTNTPPSVARERFLDPESLIPIRQINPNVGARTEKAILWAMSLHPDDRPDDVEMFRRALLGDTPIHPRTRKRSMSIRDILGSSTERILWIVSIALVITSLLVTVIKKP